MRNERCSVSSFKQKENTNQQKDVSSNKEEEAEKYADEDSKRMTDKETEEGSDQNSNKDQDSDASFQEATDEEIDATENEEDWLDRIHQKKHQRGWRTFSKTQDTMPDWNTQKTEVANGKKTCFPSLKKMD